MPPTHIARRRVRIGVAVCAAIAVLAGGLAYLVRQRAPVGPPPRATARIATPQVSSSLDVPVYIDMADLSSLLDAQIPHRLWQIDVPDAVCAPPQHVSLFGSRLAITPKLHCHIRGSVVRGPITLRGSGRTLVADVPILAHVDADRIAGVVNTHADGQTMVHVWCSFAITRDWQPHGSVALSYDWTVPPAITLLGQRITITDKADERLKPVIAQVSRKLPDMLARLGLRDKLAGQWRKGFAVIKLNPRNPEVWMRVVPQKLSYRGYNIEGNRLRLNLGLVALTQAVVGPRPADPVAAPLPDMADAPALDNRVHLFVPVSADYAALVPVLARALAKRSARPFTLPGLGAVDARFDRIEVFGASHGRLAVGADVVATPRNGVAPAMQGRIWFAGRPFNAPDSQVVHFSDLSVSGNTSDASGALLVAIGNSPGFADAIADALTQDFTRDYRNLESKIQRAVADRPQGNLRIVARIEQVHNETIAAYADGLFMPVRITGQANLTYQPQLAQRHAGHAP